MTEIDDAISIAKLQVLLEAAQGDIKILEAQIEDLRADKYRIQGGKAVLWFIGSVVFALSAIFYNIHIPAGVKSIFHN